MAFLREKCGWGGDWDREGLVFGEIMGVGTQVRVTRRGQGWGDMRFLRENEEGGVTGDLGWGSKNPRIFP
jgi:hypothetical protein